MRKTPLTTATSRSTSSTRRPSPPLRMCRAEPSPANGSRPDAVSLIRSWRFLRQDQILSARQSGRVTMHMRWVCAAYAVLTAFRGSEAAAQVVLAPGWFQPPAAAAPPSRPAPHEELAPQGLIAGPGEV